MKDKELKQRLYTEQEIADYFGWSLATMREIRKRGEIEHLVFNDKTIRYTFEQVQNYVDEHYFGGNENDEPKY